MQVKGALGCCQPSVPGRGSSGVSWGGGGLQGGAGSLVVTAPPDQSPRAQPPAFAGAR